MDFYDELQSQPPWRRVGWRFAIEQAYRNEAAIDLIRTTTGTVVDVGWGIGGLSEYVAAYGLQRDVVGIESRQQLAVQVPHEVICADYAEVDLRAECAVAIGTLSAGSQLRSLLQFLADTAPCFVATVLDADGLRARPLLWAEHGDAAVTRADVSATGVAAEVSQLTPTDLLVARGAPPKSMRERFLQTLDGPWSSRFDATERAWLAVELQLWEDAERWLEEAPRGDERADLLREGVALLRDVAER